MSEIPQWLSRRKATKRNLQSIIGKLSFTCKVVPAGRIFLRRLIDLTTSVRLSHHHVYITSKTRKDFRWWYRFLPCWNGVAMMLDPHLSAAADMELYTDASGSHGFGAYYRGAWFRGDWQSNQTLESGKSIAWKELFAAVVAGLTWGKHWAGKRVLFHCDNQSVLDVWQQGSARCLNLMALVRRLFFTAANNNFTVIIRHIPGSSNVIADALSGAQMPKFHALAPLAAPRLTPLPAEALTIGFPDQQRHSF